MLTVQDVLLFRLREDVGGWVLLHGHQLFGKLSMRNFRPVSNLETRVKVDLAHPLVRELGRHRGKKVCSGIPLAERNVSRESFWLYRLLF